MLRNVPFAASRAPAATIISLALRLAAEGGELPHLAPWQKVSQQAVTAAVPLRHKPLFQGRLRVEWTFQPPLEPTNALECLVVDEAVMARVSAMLDGIRAMTVGGWFFCRRTGEQVFFCRGVPVIAPDGERVFTPSADYVSFCLGTDQHGFVLGTIHGNGSMPFPYVTLNEVYIRAWHQLVVAKDAAGHHKFYQNGRLIHCDADRVASGHVRAFREAPQGAKPPIRFAMPMGGRIGEAWIVAGEMAAEDVRADYEAKRRRYQAAAPCPPVELREMDAHPAANRWPRPIAAVAWPQLRQQILQKVLKQLGPPPARKVPLDAKVHSEADCGRYVRRKVSFAVQADDRMPAYLLLPKVLRGRAPAVICMYGTTSGAGKDTTVGLSGRAPGSPPHPNYSFAIDLAEAGFVALAPDWLRDGERIAPGERPYEATSFRRRFPDWSIVGKDAYDTSRAIDYLQTLPFVDGERIGMTGHSYGAGGTIHAAAIDPRIKVAVANGPVSQPQTYHEVTSLIAPRPLLVGQAVGEWRPEEEEIHAAVAKVYRALGHGQRVLYLWYPGDHDYPPAARRRMVEWFRQWLRARE